MARPASKIDLVELEKLCGMQCTDEEVAAFFGVSTRTIERRRRVERFREVMERAKAKGRVSVRRNLSEPICSLTQRPFNTPPSVFKRRAAVRGENKSQGCHDTPGSR